MHRYPEVERATALMFLVLNLGFLIFAILDARREANRQPPLHPDLRRLNALARWSIPVAAAVLITIPAVLIWLNILTWAGINPKLGLSPTNSSVFAFIILNTLLNAWKRKREKEILSRGK